jgi:hypothetical protein
LAAALHETLTEIALIINQSSPPPAQVEQAAIPERLLYPYGEAWEKLGGIGRITRVRA